MKQIDGWKVPGFQNGSQDVMCIQVQELNGCEGIDCDICIFNQFKTENKEAFKKWLKEQGECL